jgi:tRNA(Ile)-lysidine synthase
VRRAAALAAAEGDPIATGHTATDRAETVLYRLATSGGVNALPALPPAAPPFYRPLLDVTRDEVRDELRRRGLDWREDASNDDPAFARNRIRNEALPVLLALNPRADANIARTAELAAAERELLAALAAPFVVDGAADLAFRGEHVALQREVVRRAAAAAGVTVQHADVEALIGAEGAARRTLPGGAEAVAAGGWLRFHSTL